MVVPFDASLAPDVARRNFRLNVMDGVAWTASMAFMSQSAILPLFVARYTDSKLVLGLIPAIAFLGSNVMQMWGAAYTARQPRLWDTLRWQIWLPRLSIASMCLAPFLQGNWALVSFFVAYAVFCAASGFNAPVWFEFIAYIIKPQERGVFFGYRSAFGGLMSLAAAGIASWALAAFAAPLNFALCFGLATLLNFWSMSCVLRTQHDFSAAETQRQAQPPFGETVRGLLHAHPLLRRYLLARCVIALSTGATAFYVVHGKEAYHLTESSSSLLAIALAYLPALAGVSLGRLADNLGSKTVQVPAALLAGLGSLALAFAPGVPVYAAGLLLVGFANMVYTITDNKWLLELAPEQAGAALSFFNLALLPVVVGASLLSGPMAQYLGTPALFVLTGLAWILGAWAIARLAEPVKALTT